MKSLGTALCVLAVLAVLAFGVYNAVLDHYLDKINIVTEEENVQYVTQRLTDEEIEETAEQTSTQEETETEEEEIDLHGTFGTGNLPLICDTKKVTNILLLATDSRKVDGVGRSDVMMLVSINRETKKIVLCSFLRDLYAHYPKVPKNPINGGYDKLNHAHAYGGPELTMAVLKETFNIEVKYYAKVNFFSFVKVVDALGGLDVELTEAEIRYLNKYEYDNAVESKAENYKAATLKVEAGVHHLNGVQALTHARNRKLGSDFQRTQRQRTLISAMVKKASTLSLPEINNLLEVFLPLITTNMQKDMMKDLVGRLPSMIGYSIESTKVPLEGTYSSKKNNLVPNLKKNCYPLYELIYDEKPEIVEESTTSTTKKAGSTQKATTKKATTTTKPATSTTTGSAPVSTPSTTTSKPTDTPTTSTGSRFTTTTTTKPTTTTSKPTTTTAAEAN